MLKGFLFKILSVIFLLPIGLYGTTHYVNSTTGNDLWDGSSDTFVSGTVGPKVSITGGIAAATSGDTLNISGDFVTEPVITLRNWFSTCRTQCVSETLFRIVPLEVLLCKEKKPLLPLHLHLQMEY